MPGLHELLEDAVTDPASSHVVLDVDADLRRGRRALNRRRTRWAAGVTGCLVAAGAVGWSAVPRHQDTIARPAGAGPSSVPMPFYDLPDAPAGWHLVGERAQYAMLTRDGSGVTSVDSGFVGQVVVMLTDGNDPFESQPSLQYDGRTFYVNAANDTPSPDGGPAMATLSVRSSGGDWLQVQYPQAAFGVHDMAAYLDGVVVEAGARPGLG